MNYSLIAAIVLAVLAFIVASYLPLNLLVALIVFVLVLVGDYIPGRKL